MPWWLNVHNWRQRDDDVDAGDGVVVDGRHSVIELELWQLQLRCVVPRVSGRERWRDEGCECVLGIRLYCGAWAFGRLVSLTRRMCTSAALNVSSW